jgi:hypothetical protein
MKKLGEKRQFTTLGRLVSVAPVVLRMKDGVSFLSFVACIRCISDSQRKDISDKILKGRMNKEKFITRNGNEIGLVSSQYPFSKTIIDEMMTNVVNEMKQDLSRFVKFNTDITEPGKSNIMRVIPENISFTG